MRADRNKKITIIQPVTSTQDEYGEPLGEYITIYTLWASYEPLIGKEYFLAEQTQSEVVGKFRTQYVEGITTDMQIVFEGTTYDIQSVIDFKSQHRELIIMCKLVR